MFAEIYDCSKRLRLERRKALLDELSNCHDGSR
jgi:hypothetical protein